MAASRRSQRATAATGKNYKELEEEESDGWDDSDEDQNKPAAGFKRKATKGVKTEQKSAPSRKRLHTTVNVDLHDLTLLDIIIKHSNAIDKAVEEWVGRYRENRAAAAAELMTLLVKVAGCDQEVTEEDVEGGDVDQLAQRLYQAVEEEGGVEVLRNPRSGHTIATNYSAFWDKALRCLATAELLFDDFELNDKVVRLVTALNISTVRSFRHAATLTAAQLVSSWISISAGLIKSRELAKFQLDAEEKKKKKAGGAASSTAAALKRTLDRCHTRVEDLKNFRSVIFSGVFSHRFRDVDDTIRAIVISSIGGWIADLPAEFLADTYLKYLGWALSDQSALVRKKAVEAISKLYKNSENVARLQEFANRFAPRFVELMADIDIDVAAAALHLLAQLVQLKVLKHKDVSDVFKLLACDDATLRHAGAELVVQLLEDHGRSSITEAAEALQEAAAAADAQPTGKGKAAAGKGKGSSRAKGTAGQQSAAAAAAAAMLQDLQKLQLAGLLAVMADMEQGASQPAGGFAIEQAASQSAATGIGAQPAVLSLWKVLDLVDALWEHLHEVLSDIGGLCDELANEGSGELRGRLGNIHLASLLAAAVYRCVHPPASAATRKGRAAARGRAATAADRTNVDEDTQQEVSVVLAQKLPGLLTMFQSEPSVAAPLLAIPPHTRIEQWQLSSQTEGYRALLQQVDGLLQRHSHLPLINAATAVLVHANKNGPAALQEIGTQELHTTCKTVAAKLASAAVAVGKLPAQELAEGVIDLAANPAEAPGALLSLLTAMQRVKVLMVSGADELSRDKHVSKACQTLLQQSLTGRELGTEIMQLLVHTTNASLLWQQRSAQHNPAAVAPYVQSRSTFMKVLEALLDSGASEQLVQPDQLLGRMGDLLETQGSQGLPADVTELLSAGIPTLQDLAAQLLIDHIFIAGGLGLASSGHGESAAAWAAAGAKLVPSMTLLNKLWRYCLSVLDREGPDLEALAEEDKENDELGGAADIEGWDREEAVELRAMRHAAKRDALVGAATTLALLKRGAVLGLVRLVGFKVVPDPGYSYLLARLVMLLDGRPVEISSLVKEMLKQLKASAPDAAPANFLNALTLLYEETIHGEDTDEDTWRHLEAVSHRLASLYPGHNLSQGPLHSLINSGISWVMDEPAHRADFLPTCLTPFTAKLAPTEADKVVQDLKGRMPTAQDAVGEDEDALLALQEYLKALEARAAGKKPTHGVLKTPGRAATAATSDKQADATDDTPAVGNKKSSRSKLAIKFAADVELQADEEEAAAITGRKKRGRQPAAAAGAGSSKRAKKQQQDADDMWDNTPGGEDSDSDGWHTKHSGSKGPAKQQQQRGRQEQQHKSPMAAKQQQLHENEEEEDAIEEYAEPAPSARAALLVKGARCPGAGASPRTDLRIIDSDAGPLNTQSQSQSKGGRTGSRRTATAAAAASPAAVKSSKGRSTKTAATVEELDELLLGLDSEPATSHTQEQLPRMSRARGRGGGAPAAATAPAASGGRPSRQARQLTPAAEQALTAASDEELEEDVVMEDAGGAAELAAGTDEEDDHEQLNDAGDLQAGEEDMDEDDGYGSEQPDEAIGGVYLREDDMEQQPHNDTAVQPAHSQYSEPLPSLNVVLDEMPDDDGGEEVDEPPRTKRPGRRRR